jgi:serine/threonine protein kinase
MTLPLSTVVGGYTILANLARGGMAEVYLARHSRSSAFSKVVVLKVILPHLAEVPEFIKMFENEANLAALLNHPNIVQVFDFGEESGVTFMAMEYIDGPSLTRILRATHSSQSRVPVPIAARIVRDTCAALHYAHGLTDPKGSPLHIIHRDVSLDNILLSYSGQVKIVDFGIAKARHLESFTQAGVLRGKYSYMAPEMILSRDLDHRIDVYATGVVLFRLLLVFDRSRYAPRAPSNHPARAGEGPLRSVPHGWGDA